MCGISGVFDEAARTSQSELEARVNAMSTQLYVRGPDEGGVWASARDGIALGHRRLSILDLSAEGHQPMSSPSGRYVLTFNGEIYNFRELRADLGETSFRGHSDTEVMLACFERFGIDRSIHQFNGMFAFAVWDRDERTLYLCRDRLGEKPLYYGWFGSTFLFGSELKALKSHPAFNAEIDRGAVGLFLRHSYIPGPHTVYQGVYKLPPGTVMSVSRGGSRTPTPKQYWSLSRVAEEGARSGFTGTPESAVQCLDELLTDAVKLRMVADVPLGAFLSGGIDSSTIVALMQANSSARVKTFTIGFHDRAFNEAEHAAAIARHLGTEHTELYVTPQQAMSVIPNIPTLYDEPFADFSQIPTFLVSQLARQSVTVSLSGDGGDELFGGYKRYALGISLCRLSRIFPKPLIRQMIRAGVLASHVLESDGATILRPLLPLASKISRAMQAIGAENPKAMYLSLVSQWKNPATVMIEAEEPATELNNAPEWPSQHDLLHQMMYADTVTYLPDDILVKLDRASMGVSLESRVPLLDHRVVEFAWRLPPSMKVNGSKAKWILKQVLYRYVPRSLVDRPKTGFAIPLDRWIRGPLRDWAEELLSERRLREDGFFRPEPIRSAWLKHVRGANYFYPLWNVLMFQAWLEGERHSKSTAAEQVMHV